MAKGAERFLRLSALFHSDVLPKFENKIDLKSFQGFVNTLTIVNNG